MQQYKDYAPTAYDSRGLMSEEVGADNLVLPVIQTRDSMALEQSNFRTALSMLGGESEAVTVHQFNHWAHGWYEIIVVDHTSVHHVAIAQEIETSIEDYPVLSEDDLIAVEVSIATEWNLTQSETGEWIDSDGNRIDLL